MNLFTIADPAIDYIGHASGSHMTTDFPATSASDARRKALRFESASSDEQIPLRNE
jgi:hypothetical protein